MKIRELCDRINSKTYTTAWEYAILETSKEVPPDSEYITQYSSGTCLYQLPDGQYSLVKLTGINPFLGGVRP